MNYTIYRNTYPIHVCRPEGKQEREIMVKDLVPVTIQSDDPIHFQIGDYITVYGEEYTLNAEPSSTTHHNNSKYTYELEFQAQWYRLAKWKYRGYNSSNALTEETFELMGTLDDFLTLGVANANRLSSGWLKGDVESNAERKLITFNGENILTSLSNIAQEFGTELNVINKTIHLKKISAPSGLELEYMKGIQGGMQRTRLDTGNVFSRLTVFGSEQNIPADYRGGRRKLTIPAPNEFIQGPLWGKDEIEASITFDEVKPERIGTITSVGDMYTFSDTGIDFDINAQLLPNGLSAKIDFLTGNLAGYQFEIAKGGYTHSTRTIRIVPNEQEKANILPDSVRKPAIGDTYSIVDIQMPAQYVTTAENLLLTKGTEYFAKESKPKSAYSLPADPFDWEARGIVLTLGNTVHVKAHDLLLDSDVRIIAYSRDLHDPHKYTDIKLSDFATGSPINRIYAEREKTVKALESAKVFDIQRNRDNWRSTTALANELDTVRGEMLLITIDGGAYATTITATANATDFATTTGRVVHNQFTENNGIWDVPAFSASLPDDIPYWVYVKAPKTSSSGTIVLSETKITLDAESASYYLPFGYISTRTGSNRDFQTLAGYTKVTGGQIGTGSIVANNGLSNINLDNGTFDFVNDLARIAFTDAGVVLDGKIIATNAEFVNLLVQNIVTDAPNFKRVSITKANNNIQIYNAANRVLIEADDDSAVEGSYSNTTPPILDLDGNFPKNYLGQQIIGGTTLYFYANLGPGVSVGISPTDANGYSTLGRKEVYTNGKFRAANASGLQESSIDRTGVRTTGLLDISGNAILRAKLDVTGEAHFFDAIRLTGLGGAGGDAALRIDANGIVYRA